MLFTTRRPPERARSAHRIYAPRIACTLVSFVLALALALPALAVDGVIEINQTKALAGGVVPLDTPGFPVRLEAGSYRLTGDLVSSTTALEVVSNQVTIDLNGFAIRCQACTPATDGIRAYLVHHVHILNGVVEGFSGSGIVAGSWAQLDRMVMRGNGSHGFDGSIGIHARITSSVAENNGANGFFLGSGGTVLDSNVNTNTAQGIRCQGDCTVEGCQIEGNTLNGIWALTGGVLRRNQILLNQQHGIRSDGAGLIEGNRVSQNTLQGIQAASALVVRNFAYLNTGDGIQVGDGAHVVDNVSNTNGGDGIEVTGSAKVDRNMIGYNTGAGLRFPGGVNDSTYQGNTLTGNALPGITGFAQNAGDNFCNIGGGAC